MRPGNQRRRRINRLLWRECAEVGLLVAYSGALKTCSQTTHSRLSNTRWSSTEPILAPATPPVAAPTRPPTKAPATQPNAITAGPPIKPTVVPIRAPVTALVQPVTPPAMTPVAPPTFLPRSRVVIRVEPH